MFTTAKFIYTMLSTSLHENFHIRVLKGRKSINIMTLRD